MIIQQGIIQQGIIQQGIISSSIIRQDDLARIFIDLDPTANSHYQLATAWTASGDFRITCQFSTVSTVGSSTVVSGSAASNDEIVIDIQPTGEVRFFAFDGTTARTAITSITQYNDGKLHSIDASFVAGTAELIIDGVSAGTAAWTLSSPDVKYLGTRTASTNYFNDIIANVKLEDLSTPSNTQTYSLNQPTANTENSAEGNNSVTYQNIAASQRELFTKDSNGDWLGDQVITDTSFDDAGEWAVTGNASVSGGSADVDGTSGQSLVFQSALTNGVTYKGVIDVTFDDGNTNNEVWNNNGQVLHEINGVGAQEFVFTHAIASGNILLRANGGRYVASSLTVNRFLEVAT